MKTKTSLPHENPLFQVEFTKELFVETINEIEKQYIHDCKCAEAFGIIFTDDFISGYKNHWLQNQLLKILQIAMKDSSDWTGYYMWELDFGRKWRQGSVTIEGKDFKLQTASDLWDLLNLK